MSEQQNQNQPIAKVASGVSVEKGVVSDVVSTIHALGGPAAVLGTARYVLRYGTDVANNAITQQAETRREQLRQVGETERAQLAQQNPPLQQTGNN